MEIVAVGTVVVVAAGTAVVVVAVDIAVVVAVAVKATDLLVVATAVSFAAVVVVLYHLQQEHHWLYDGSLSQSAKFDNNIHSTLFLPIQLLFLL